MAAKKKSWQDKYFSRTVPEKKILETSFAGMKPGQLMLISTPQEIDAWIRDLKPGELRTLDELRESLANKHQAEVTCPATTSIFLRIVAELAWEEIQAGASPKDVTPFWRVVEPNSKLALRLSCTKEWLAEMRSTDK